MQSVSAAFTAEEADDVRSIAHSLLVSWKKFSTLGNRTFTIGTSLIGGNDIIGANPGAIGSPGNYKYFDESDYVLGLGWEQGLKMPVGGLNKGLVEAELDNTSGRFTPRYMGGTSELFTAILPRRPLIINAGFDFDGIDQTVPQFAGILNYAPEIRVRDRSIKLKGADYVDFFQDKYMDSFAMFTGQRTDQILGGLFQQLGMSTAQYDLDTGINTIPFSLLESGTRFSDAIDKLVEAENGQLYQDEEGIFRFENRQHWDSSPHNSISKILLTGQVLDAEAPNTDHLINVVEVKGVQYHKQPLAPIMDFSQATQILANSTVELFFDYGFPVLSVITPTIGGADSYYLANIEEDESGTDVTSSVSVKNISNFSTTSKITFQNNSASNLFLTRVVISGRSAQKIGDIYARVQDDSSVTAFEERGFMLENEFIQDQTWANSLGQVIVNDFSQPENIQKLTTRAIPELQLGDLVSWQGRYWRIFNIASTLNPSVGFVQELTVVQRNIQSYFRIGISTIGGADKIAP